MGKNEKSQKPAKTFQDLIVWQKAHRFVLEIYKISRNFPSDEKYGLTSQLRRAAVSVPANIEEGFPKKTNVNKARFYNISKGSLEEVRYYLILSQDLGYSDNLILVEELEEVSRLLYFYTKTILTSES